MPICCNWSVVRCIDRPRDGRRTTDNGPMLTCPLCKKSVAALERECPSCHADLTLLVEYVVNLAGGLARAEALTRASRLGEAVWAYLEVLETDPDNAVA